MPTKTQSGLVHGKKSAENTHQARPLNSLTDPSSFAPPPTRRGTGLAPAPPPTQEKRTVVLAPSKYQDPRAAPVVAPHKVSQQLEQQQQPPQPPQRQISQYSQDSQQYDGATQQQQQLTYPQQQQEEYEEEPAPRGPYRVNTTGLSTDHLPKPPGRRDGANGKTPPPAVPPPPSYNTALSHPQQPPSKPGLPPRLPARTNAGSTPSYTPPSAPASPAPSSNNLLNQDAVNRLGNAGVSVPAFGIGSKPVASPSPPPPPRRQTIPANGSGAHLGELQNRFSKLNTTSQSSDTTAPAGGTTWAQKQAALNTASSLQKDPSSVTMADARSAAGVANNFRERHGDQVSSGVRSANNINQKYGVANKFNSFVGGGAQQEAPAPASPVPGLANKKKPPPPPPKKKPGLGGSIGAVAVRSPSVGDDDAPPPIPLATRPTF